MTRRFITFEGIDGAGKSTHIAPLAERLRARGQRVVCTREPGGTPLAETLRELLLHAPMDGVAETLLVFAARRDHIERVIAPALERGETVLCDRFSDATFAYQGAGRGFDVSLLTQLEQWVHAGRQPDLTLWFDVPAEVAARRRAEARRPDRFERQDDAFFERVRAGYLARRSESPARFERIDATGSRDQVWQRIEAALGTRGW
jgi:dTMP kinase